jgi:hypothetical protein
MMPPPISNTSTGVSSRAFALEGAPELTKGVSSITAVYLIRPGIGGRIFYLSQVPVKMLKNGITL